VSSVPTSQAEETGAPKLAAKLGLFDASMIVMGGVIGSGIFVNPAVVARHVGSPVLILGAWLVGGVLALMGAMIYAELGALLPKAGGSYAYLHDGFHPILGFLYGWFSLLVINAGGTAAVSLVFAKYLSVLLPVAIPEKVVAACTILVLAGDQLLGRAIREQCAVGVDDFTARRNSGFDCWRNWLVLQELWRRPRWFWRTVLDRPVSADLGVAFGSAMIPVFFGVRRMADGEFSGGGDARAAKESAASACDGVLGVVALYVASRLHAWRCWGRQGWPELQHRASDVMQRVLGSKGAVFMAVGIAISTLGFLSQSVLTYPRVFFCNGSGWSLPCGSGASECAYSSARGGDSAGEFADDGGGTGRKLRCDSGVRGVDGRAVFLGERAGAVCLSAARKGGRYGRGVSCAGASVDHNDLCGGILGGSGEFVLQVPGERGVGLGDLAGGCAAVFLLEPGEKDEQKFWANG
jgi:hypothetical protein